MGNSMYGFVYFFSAQILSASSRICRISLLVTSLSNRSLPSINLMIAGYEHYYLGQIDRF